MGRPRTFEIDEAVDRAMTVFWRRGYDGASLTDLTEAMGIERTSLYAAFGSKEGLFEIVLERYLAGPSGYMERALAEPTARGVAEALLGGAADLHADPATPPGCLTVSGALIGGSESEGPEVLLREARTSAEVRVRERLVRAVEDGDLPPGADASALAAYLRVVTYGMAVRAMSGVRRSELQAVIDQAMGSWPSD
jgi:AcrR family transcriptional regulator